MERSAQPTGAIPGTQIELPRPLLRGWFHAAAAVIAVVFTIALAIASWQDGQRLVSMLVFGLSMVELYTVSAIYHIGTWSPRVKRVLRSVDHTNIFVVIAGTYTAICFNVLDGWIRDTILIVIWLLAIFGLILAIFKPRVPRWVGTGIYIGMGWVIVLALPSLLAALPWQALTVLAIGGVLYTLGAVVYALKRPNPFPKVLGFHEVFHLFVIAGSVAHSIVVWIWVLPYPRA
ncbi:MAG: hemolysin III family protein [Chloroflexia bacterium]